MLLVGHEHIMKIPENYMTSALVILGIALMIVAIYCSKSMKAHIMAFCMLP